MKRQVKVGNTVIGDGNVTIQSMTNTKTSDIDSTVAQIKALEDAGCQLVRCSVPDEESATALKEIIKNVNVPIIADIHFSHKLALMSADAGVSKIRINPGNIGGVDKAKYLADYLKERSVALRIGVNGGSLDSAHKSKPLAVAMRDSALEYVSVLEKCNFYDIVISAKSSNVKVMLDTYRLLDKSCDYPLHLGVTEAGLYHTGLVKSAIGIGALLCEGIGDTIRVSLSDDPVKEVEAAKDILKACDKYPYPYCEIISCPTCARTNIAVKALAEQVEEMCKDIKRNLKIAVMGCVVNGIGESQGANLGVAGGKDKSAIFVAGEYVESVANEDILLILKKY
ncbi:MAG: flavodoxin-dependent (E)-4-hydroxy-3-methylbut-2-enyl-diphosphate synthase, partial [Clostridia bacterium]|nr:flavodoxin-dependent (E)-4-hydroxy-3-methylbut-2-enyl-diphosphate synthase [Clostridia bacterium]